MGTDDEKLKPGYKWIYRPFYTKNGKRFYAAAYGLKAWKFQVPADQPEKKPKG